MNSPLVSICCITYNHSLFIRECIDGFMMQETNFDYEIIINDDASTDGTREILLEYKNKYPEKFKLILQVENQWSQGVRGIFARFTFPRARGKYIALCEGDDYWTDPFKLQKQVDFLEANPDFSICFHPVEILENGEIYPDDLKKVADETTILDLAKGNYIHTPSVVFRNLPECWGNDLIKKSPVGDYVLHMLNARHGKIKKLAETMAVYRKGVGIWSSQQKTAIYKKWIVVLTYLIDEFKDLPSVKKELLKQKLSCQKALRKQNPILTFVKKGKDFLTYRLFLQWKK